MRCSRSLALLALSALAGCAHPRPAATPLAPAAAGPVAPVQLAPAPFGSGTAEARINGDVGSPTALTRAQIAVGRQGSSGGFTGAGGNADLAGGDVTLEFADTDIRDVVSQILGDTLQVTYSIDPAVRGTATFHSAKPIARSKLIPLLQGLLAQNNATLVQTGDLYRVAPAASAGVPNFSTDDPNAGGLVIPLHYASAEDLVKVLQPVVGAGAKLAAATGRNAIVVIGEPQSRAALTGLINLFDTDLLAGQSYALLPVPEGDAKDMASTLQEAFRSQSGGALAGLVKVLPLERANAVLLVTNSPAYLSDAQRVYALVQRNQALTERSWHVYYLENSRANDIAYILQKAFTPHDVSAQPEQNTSNQGSNATGAASLQGNSGGSSGASSVLGANSSSTSGTSGGGIGGPGGSSSGGGSQGALTLAGGSSGGANPLIGSLESGGGGDEDANAMRIIPDPQNNSVVVYATPTEEDTVEAMLRKIDLLPLQVRIDATIAEVTLNDTLNFGTQFFFKEGSVNETLSNATTAAAASGFPGFVFGATAKGVQATLSALQAVTTVHVLSSPELMVLDNQAATLQVGSLVPYLTSTSTSNVGGDSPTVNSIDYRPTGVLMQVTPRVNSGGLVTMDIAQEVSAVDTSATAATGINSPTFSDRSVRSRVVVQDGQTVGLAGLITDTNSTGNSGIPWLKDIPILGLLTGTQANSRQRTELLILITPHVVHDQRDALALTQDLQDQLVNAAAVPREAQTLEPTGSTDPSARLRRRLGLTQ